jgi:hypothetical protein
MKPFITHQIERQPRLGCALVTIKECWFEDDGPVRSIILEQYETANRGATASARRAVCKARNAAGHIVDHRGMK